MSQAETPNLIVHPKGYGLVFEDARVFFWNARTVGSKENECIYEHLQQQFSREDVADYATMAYAGLQQSPSQEAIRLNLNDFIYYPETQAMHYYAHCVNYSDKNASITITGNMIAAWIRTLKDLSLSWSVENPNWSVTHQAPVAIALHWMEEATHVHQFSTGEVKPEDLLHDAQVKAQRQGQPEAQFYDLLIAEVATRPYLNAAEPVLDQNPDIVAANERMRARAEKEQNPTEQGKKPDTWALG